MTSPEAAGQEMVAVVSLTWLTVGAPGRPTVLLVGLLAAGRSFTVTIEYAGSTWLPDVPCVEVVIELASGA